MTWTTSTIDADGSGDKVSMAVDGSGNIHVAYIDGCNTGYLLYAVYTGSWAVETIDESGGSYPSIAIDNDGVPCVAYNSGGINGTFKYASRSGGTWSTEDAANYTGGGTYKHCVLLFDTSNDPHIIYQPTYLEIRHATDTGGGWSDESIEAWANSLSNYDFGAVIDGNVMHVAWRSSKAVIDGDNEIRYAVKTVGGSWSAETAYVAIYDEPKVSICLDGSNVPHLFLWQNDGGGVKLVHVYKSGTWQSETAIAAATAPPYTTGYSKSSVAIDGNDEIYLSFLIFDASYDNWVGYASGTTGDWSAVTMVATMAGADDDANSIAIKAGLPIIAYSAYDSDCSVRLAEYSVPGNPMLAMMHYKRLRQ